MLSLYKDILTSTDFSSTADKALIRANELAELTGAKLTILHVLEHFPEDIPNDTIAPENTDPQQYYLESARKRLQESLNKLKITGAVSEILVSTHSAAKEIVHYASNRILKKSFHGLFQPRKRKTRFPASFIFNGLQPSKMAAHPCATHRLLKNCVFQQPAKNNIDLIVLAQHGSRGILSSLGSTTGNVLHNATMDVLSVGN